MGATVIRSPQIEDGGVKRADLNVSTSGSAVVAKIVAGTNVTLSSTGPDSGTGDVTINAAGTTTYTVTTADADNTASNTHIFSITVPANTWADGETIYFEGLVESKQNAGSAVNLTFGGSYAGNSGQATANSMANSATLSHFPALCSVTRIGTSLYFYRGTWADLMTAVSADQFSGIRGFILTGQSFTGNSTLTIDLQWGSANALTFYRILGAAKAYKR